MAKSVGNFVLARLRQWGVKRLFGYPGDGRDGALDFVQVRHDPDRDAVLKQLARQLAL